MLLCVLKQNIFQTIDRDSGEVNSVLPEVHEVRIDNRKILLGIETNCSSCSKEDSSSSESDDEDDDWTPTEKKGLFHMTTARVIEVLERTGVTDRTACMIFEALILDGHTKSNDLNKYVLDHNQACCHSRAPIASTHR